MRIAVIFHANHKPEDAGHAIGLIAELWRKEGHEVRLLVGCREHWDADIAILHVDMSTVPKRYVKFARRYPLVINGRILDIRKSRISRNLLDHNSNYEGRVILKTDLNSAGIPERTLLTNALWHRVRRRFRLDRAAKQPLDFVKRYSIHESIKHVPAEALTAPGMVIEKFVPETEGEWYFVRRSFILGDRMISYRMGDRQPIVEAGLPGVFEWIENSPEVLAVSRELGLEYGTIDYTTNEGEMVVLDVNKTPGRAAPPDEAAMRDYEAILNTIAPGINKFFAAGTAGGVGNSRKPPPSNPGSLGFDW
jgi:hypothetical protein